MNTPREAKSQSAGGSRRRAVIFDMDGVIFDTEPLYFAAEDAMLRKRGHRFTPALAQEIMGIPGRLAMQILVDRLNLTDSADELFDEAQAGFQAEIAKQLPVMAGFPALLALAEGRQIPRAVATSTHRELALRMLQQYELPNRFQAILTRDGVTHGKPHPEIFESAAARLGVFPADTLVLEDSLNGVLAGLSAGCHVVAVRHSHNQHLRFPEVAMEATSMADIQLHSFFADWVR